MIVAMDGEKVRAMREAEEMGSDELAAKAGISPRTLAKAEKGGGPLHLKTACKIARALGVEAKSLGRAVSKR